MRSPLLAPDKKDLPVRDPLSTGARQVRIPRKRYSRCSGPGRTHVELGEAALRIHGSRIAPSMSEGIRHQHRAWIARHFYCQLPNSLSLHSGVPLMLLTPKMCDAQAAGMRQ
jgi:hypothetical protein